ncbi:hypothetical protein GCM10012285_10190 [Streptomyces kronopolitis]|uniref:Uncharacterized protein n=1 Tax=Streptomyces kronopolitis TaxID=1612435 RepID=A0ABQ2J2J2_9ACTN|nr:hypothetical protein [Streptomyces kronopolitis]GGN36437.1 hypothetical protein GCM10012285_10190 [Streptomyces kronopolitis]
MTAFEFLIALDVGVVQGQVPAVIQALGDRVTGADGPAIPRRSEHTLLEEGIVQVALGLIGLVDQQQVQIVLETFDDAHVGG